jgi:hypothetical protein
MGMMVAPLFDFILAAVTDTEVGSASGVLNAVQQLGGAIGVAGIGTLFFSTLQRSGFVTAINHSLLVELATTPVLLALISMLPKRAREGEAAPAPSADLTAEKSRMTGSAVDTPRMQAFADSRP